MAGLVCAVCGGQRALTDALTGLADRAAFSTALAARIAEAGPDWHASDQLAVLLIDLDRFKAVNDTLGHGAGDTLLGLVGRRLRKAVREGDIAARLGGDEFAVLLAGPVARETVTVIATRIIDLLSQPYMIDGCIATIGASAGAAMLQLAIDATADALMRQADLAMYQAKGDGRGRFNFFEPAYQLRAEARRTLEIDLRAALALDQFVLFYQPQMDVKRERLVGFEALIRWRHPTRGLVPPDDFIVLSQEIGLIIPIGAWVLNAACREAMLWPSETCVSVNVAAQQFDDGMLVRTVAAALARSGLPGKRLDLEITESALLRSGEQVLAQLHAIKAMGVQVSLDDFGTGYSSLTQLRSFPFNRVKIDRSFVDDDAVVRAVAALGASLGMRTTAEGMETPAQMSRLREDGCSDVQGFLLSRPVPAGQVKDLIRILDDPDRGRWVGALTHAHEQEHAV